MDEYCQTGKRKYMRQGRQIQLSPVKETYNQSIAFGEENIGSRQEEHLDLPVQFDKFDKFDKYDLELKLGPEKFSNSLVLDWRLIVKIEEERVLLFVHHREQDVPVPAWKFIQEELKSQITDLCIKVNQDLLLQDLNETRLCNRLLEPETNEDAWRDNGRQLSMEDYSDAPYLEANLNMRWVPGKFHCPEVWRTSFSLHPRLKQGQGHIQSWGLQTVKTVLLHNMVSNRSDMFVHMDDKKNIYYIKISEQMTQVYPHSVISRQTSIISKEEDSFSRTSSVGSSKQMRKTSLDYYREDSHHVTLRSNSVGESDRSKNEDQIIFKVYGITEVGKNVKEDLTAVLQKKLDDKVVEVISTMLKRNIRCKLATEDVLFLQKPGSLPTSTLQFKVHVQAMPYLLAIVFYLKQNLVHNSLLIQPNYTAGNTRRFKDTSSTEDHLHPNSFASDADVFIYNDHNEKGGKNGIACLAMSIVDGKGHFFRPCSYPKPVSSLSSTPSDISDLTELIQTELYMEDEEPKIPGPGPMALIQFKVWESGRVDMSKLTSHLENAIMHSLWDVVVEFKLLPEPICIGINEEDLETDTIRDLNSSVDLVFNTSMELEQLKPEPKKLTLKRLSEEAIIAYGYSSSSSVPQIVVVGKEASEVLDPEPADKVPTPLELGDRGSLSVVMHKSLWSWFEVGKDLESPSCHIHSVNISTKHELPTLLKELANIIRDTVLDLDVKLFNKQTPENIYLPFSTSKPTDEFFIVGRNIKSWKHVIAENQDLNFLKNACPVNLQRFPSLLQTLPLGDSSVFYTPGSNLHLIFLRNYDRPW